MKTLFITILILLFVSVDFSGLGNRGHVDCAPLNSDHGNTGKGLNVDEGNNDGVENSGSIFSHDDKNYIYVHTKDGFYNVYHKNDEQKSHVVAVIYINPLDELDDKIYFCKDDFNYEPLKDGFYYAYDKDDVKKENGIVAMVYKVSSDPAKYYLIDDRVDHSFEGELDPFYAGKILKHIGYGIFGVYDEDGQQLDDEYYDSNYDPIKQYGNRFISSLGYGSCKYSTNKCTNDNKDKQPDCEENVYVDGESGNNLITKEDEDSDSNNEKEYQKEENDEDELVAYQKGVI